MSEERSSFVRKSFVNGLAGSLAVSVQTLSLMWIQTILQQSKKTGESLMKASRTLYQSGGLIRFYKGFMPSFRSAALARFGDNSTNMYVLSHFQSRNNIKNVSLGIQSAIIWMIAGTWRLAIMPFDALDLKSRREILDLNAIGNLRKNLKRIYLKRTRPEIISLYFWFSTQNYLMYYLPNFSFKDNFLMALLRNGIIGFCSMICFDLFLAGVRRFKNISPAENNYGVLLGESGRTLLKGCHGIVFCTSSNYIRQMYSSFKY